MRTLTELLQAACTRGAADIFIVSGVAPSCRADGELVPLDSEKVMPDSAEVLIKQAYELAGRESVRLYASGDDDFSFAVPGMARFRASTYKQRGSLAAVIRVIPFGIPSPEQCGIPEKILSVAQKIRGLVIVTGPAGGGKSTTQACIIDRINETRASHIITLEEPIEYLHRNKKSIISQREIELDSENFVTALRASLRQSPDVILVGEMRDHETIRTALTAAETGHLVISTLHTLGAANTIDRIIDVFPPEQQQQIRVQLSMVLQSVISQQLAPTKDGQVVPAFEIMHATPAIKNLIREARVHQIDAVIAAGAKDGMQTMDADLLRLVREGKIEKDTALRLAVAPDLMEKKLNTP